MNGTSIQDLQNSEKMSTYSALQKMQSEGAHNAADSIQQAQHLQYYLSQNTPINPKTCGASQQESASTMDELAEEIKKNMPSAIVKKDASEQEMHAPVEEHFETGIINYIPEVLRLPLVIIIIYLILSHTTVKQLIGTYIPQINPDASGKICIVGILIYGAILATLVVLSKNLLQIQ